MAGSRSGAPDDVDITSELGFAGRWLGPGVVDTGLRTARLGVSGCGPGPLAPAWLRLREGVLVVLRFAFGFRLGCRFSITGTVTGPEIPDDVTDAGADVGPIAVCVGEVEIDVEKVGVGDAVAGGEGDGVTVIVVSVGDGGGD